MDLSGVIQFLEAFSPSELEKLREDSLDARARLQKGGVLGNGDASPIEFRAVSLALHTVVESTEEAVSLMQARLRNARRLEVAGVFLSALGSMGAVIANLGFNSTIAGALFAAFAFLAGVVPAAANWLRGSLTSADIAPTYLRARECSWEAQQALVEMRRGEGASEQFVKNVNAISKRAYSIMGELGIASRLTPV